MSNPNSIDHSQAAIKAASKYAQDKCLNLVHSAANIVIDPPHSGSSDEYHSPNSIYSNKKISSLTTSPMYSNKNDDVVSSLLTDEPGDFGIDRHIVQAALAALGLDTQLFIADKACSPGAHITTGPRRPKKKFSDMDEDERLLASSEAKKLSARQRRQIRNRVSARQFRLRRKEYISQLESLVVKMTTKITTLQKALAESKTENNMLKEVKTTVVQPKQQQQHFQQQEQLQEKQQLFNDSLLVLPEYSQSDTTVVPEVFPDLFMEDHLNSNLNIASYQEQHLNVSPSSSCINSPWSGSISDISTGWSSNTAKFTNSMSATSAESIRMSPNIINLLPPYPDQLLEWPEQPRSDSGYIQIPDTRIYHSKVPHLKEQLVLGQKKLEKEASVKFLLSPKAKSSNNLSKDKKVKMLAEDKLSILMVDTLFKSLDMKMGTLKI